MLFRNATCTGYHCVLLILFMIMNSVAIDVPIIRYIAGVNFRGKSAAWCSFLGRAGLVLEGGGNGGGGGASDRASTGANPMEGLIQWKHLTLVVQERHCVSLCVANLLDSCLEEFLHFLLSHDQVNAV